MMEITKKEALLLAKVLHLHCKEPHYGSMIELLRKIDSYLLEEDVHSLSLSEEDESRLFSDHDLNEDDEENLFGDREIDAASLLALSPLRTSVGSIRFTRPVFRHSKKLNLSNTDRHQSVYDVISITRHGRQLEVTESKPDWGSAETFTFDVKKFPHDWIMMLECGKEYKVRTT